ncbi:MAG: hypothetical protein ACK4Y5_00990, partial [Acetobacteraceae bacterium]
HPLFKINIAEQGTSHRVIATHHNLDPNTETVNHKYGNQATNFSSLLGEEKETVEQNDVFILLGQRYLKFS